MIKRLALLLSLLFFSESAHAADWYVSSVANTAVPQWAATTSYTATSAVRQLAAPAVNNERVFNAGGNCTSGGSEPAWNLGAAATTTDNTCTWTEVTGKSTKQQLGGVTNTWTAPAARFGDLTSTGTNVIAAGDRVFASSDHVQSQTANNIFNYGTATSLVTMVSVNRTTGNIPPVAADITAGAQITTTSNGVIELDGYQLWDGFTFTGSSNTYFQITFGFNVNSSIYLLNSSMVLGNTSQQINICDSNDCHVTLDNTTLTLSNVAQTINFAATRSSRLDWINTPSAIAGGIASTKLFGGPTSGGAILNVDGVDLSGLGSNPIFSSTFNPPLLVANFSKCKLGSSFPVPTQFGANNMAAILNIVDCDSANTNYNNARFDVNGALTTETTITRASGATDGTQAVSHKIVTPSTTKPPLLPFESFPIHIWNTATGSSKTATIEIISSGSLNNNDIWEECTVLDSSSNANGSVKSSYIATPLTAAAAVTSSSVTWNSSPATPVKQKLQVTFTPQKVGLVSCVVKVGKASTTVYVDPLITLSRLIPANDNQEEIRNVA